MTLEVHLPAAFAEGMSTAEVREIWRRLIDGAHVAERDLRALSRRRRRPLLPLSLLRKLLPPSRSQLSPTLTTLLTLMRNQPQRRLLPQSRRSPPRRTLQTLMTRLTPMLRSLRERRLLPQPRRPPPRRTLQILMTLMTPMPSPLPRRASQQKKPLSRRTLQILMTLMTPMPSLLLKKPLRRTPVMKRMVPKMRRNPRPLMSLMVTRTLTIKSFS